MAVSAVISQHSVLPTPLGVTTLARRGPMCRLSAQGRAGGPFSSRRTHREGPTKTTAVEPLAGFWKRPGGGGARGYLSKPTEPEGHCRRPIRLHGQANAGVRQAHVCKVSGCPPAHWSEHLPMSVDCRRILTHRPH